MQERLLFLFPLSSLKKQDKGLLLVNTLKLLFLSEHSIISRRTMQPQEKEKMDFSFEISVPMTDEEGHNEQQMNQEQVEEILQTKATEVDFVTQDTTQSDDVIVPTNINEQEGGYHAAVVVDEEDPEKQAGDVADQTVRPHKDTEDTALMDKPYLVDDEHNDAKYQIKCCTPSRLCCRGCMLVFMGFLLALTLSLMTALFAGARLEANVMQKANSTLSLYAADQVCGFHDDGSVETFLTEQESDRVPIGHCGACGQCSTLHDLHIYARTRNTLTHDATICTLQSFLGVRRLSRCFSQRIGFTEGCQDCWTDNIKCTRANCKWTCMKYKLLGHSNNEEDGSLNDCLECDERLCGPAFLECAGANRRQSGIVSDIGRDPESEQCESVDFDWVAITPEH